MGSAPRFPLSTFKSAGQPQFYWMGVETRESVGIGIIAMYIISIIMP